MAHNHPSGNPEPSDQDRQLTRTLYLACCFMNIRLLDHIIVGRAAETFSFADHGIMKSIAEACRPLLNGP